MHVGSVSLQEFTQRQSIVHLLLIDKFSVSRMKPVILAVCSVIASQQNEACHTGSLRCDCCITNSAICRQQAQGEVIIIVEIEEKLR